MISDARRGHVSPGIYTEERDVTYAVKSLGITSLGLVGETLYGPAFENIEVKDWSEFVDYFGGTSAEKYKGTGLPKYGLPYIAKSYLEESKRLNVVKVLGLSGYHAGPCWVLKTKNSKPVVVIRSKMEYSYDGDICEGDVEDRPKPVVSNIEKGPYTPKIYDSYCITKPSSGSTSLNSRYKFSIKVTCQSNNSGYNTDSGYYVYNVSLDPNDSDYIYKVISSSPETGTTPIYIEAVYESSMYGNVELADSFENILSEANMITSAETYQSYRIEKKEVVEIEEEGETVKKVVYRVSDNLGMLTEAELAELDGNDETIVAIPSENSEDNRLYYTGEKYFDEYENTEANPYKDKKFLKITSVSGVRNVGNMYDDYCEMYRPAQTPWFVSEAYASSETSGSSENIVITMRKLFKFLTISDGNAANTQVKVSIQKINPFKGTFDVVVRDYNDTDIAPVILEKYSNCTMNVGDSSYIGVKIGTSDGAYLSKSKYITVVLATDEDMSGSVPCGFLGFPMPSYNSDTAATPNVEVEYYRSFDPAVRSRKQYFGLNGDILDSDILKYKGVYFYDEQGDVNPNMLTKGFHMDSVVGKADAANVTVDDISGYRFDSVSEDTVTSDRFAPRIIKGEYINHTIYKDESLRKFTTYFYGGFDGWDVNRPSRTNTDEYKATKYIVENRENKESCVFTKINYNGLNNQLNLPSTAITSDYYAYLAGYRVFANPQDVDINLLATPGINWYDNKLLTLDVIDTVEDPEDGRGGDLLYIMDSPNNMSPEELAMEFEDSDIDTSYACTYFPWIMFYDSFNNQYINLPPTKDVVRNIAKTDNNSYPWFAPAGFERGNVNCVKADFKTTLVQEDTLYENRINPIKTFGKDGVKIWGNKTAYSTDSPLNRINVRRLMIRVKKLVSDAARNLIFEQYSDTLEKQFRGLVEPILADVKSNHGIYDYRLMTEVTPETRDQHILPAKILIKPTPALEYISISFVVYPESVAFEE